MWTHGTGAIAAALAVLAVAVAAYAGPSSSQKGLDETIIQLPAPIIFDPAGTWK